MALLGVNNVISLIEINLFSSERRRLDGIKSNLIIQNNALYKTLYDGFLYQGVWYFDGISTASSIKKDVHPNLVDEVEEYLSDLNTVNEDKQKIAQALWTVLEPCESIMDIRNALPECLYDTIDGLPTDPRTREAGYTIKDSPRKWKQFNKILPKMEFYSAARLIY